MIRFDKISKSFGKNQVLHEIDFEIKGAGVKAILGPNGSGKTTLIKSFLGMVLPDSGTIYWKDKDVRHRYEYRNDIGYIPQIAHYPENLRVNELLNLIASFRTQEQEAEELIDKFGLQAFMDKRMGTLSGGTLQKVSIVQAYMMDCDIYIMDEPTTGLDPLALNTFKKMVNEMVEKDKTIILTTHIMSLVEELATEIIYLLDGKVYFQGEPAVLKSERKEQTIEASIADILSEREATSDKVI
jgi:Cu-processing system ATP-binding protein